MLKLKITMNEGVSSEDTKYAFFVDSHEGAHALLLLWFYMLQHTQRKIKTKTEKAWIETVLSLERNFNAVSLYLLHNKCINSQGKGN